MKTPPVSAPSVTVVALAMVWPAEKFTTELVGVTFWSSG